MTQILKVRTNEIDADEGGIEWIVHYVLCEEFEGNNFQPHYALYEDDGHGNGAEICRGNNLQRMRSLTLRLGEFVEYGEMP